MSATVTNSPFVIIDPCAPSSPVGSEPVHHFYEFEVNFGKPGDVAVEPLLPPKKQKLRMFRPEQVDEMNAFGAATEGDAFE